MSMDSQPETHTPSPKNIRTWLFNPFHYIAGGRALVIGVLVIVAAGLLGALGNSHFDGVLDFHTGAEAPLWMFICEGIVDWLAAGALLLLGGKLVSTSRVRLLDVFGTQALARSPTLITAAFALLPGYRRFAAHLAARYLGTAPAAEVSVADGVVFAVAVIVLLIMVVWMVALIYRAYSVSCNVTGGKAVGVFIAALILAEALSKLVINLLLPRFM